ncbi:hypothetical protein L7F22_008977 [Adiantum nelumboides]|nr:hypothetical protein [Adiantum nelumboides]
MKEDDGLIPTTAEEPSAPLPLRRLWTDRYGFVLNLTEDEAAAYERMNAHVHRAELEWQSMPDAGDCKPWSYKELTCEYASDPNALSRSPFVFASEDLRHFIKNEGIPPNRRREVWTRLSGAASLRRHCPPDYYEILRQTPCSSVDTEDIEKDLHRTCGSHPWFETNEAHLLLRSVLSAYAARNPKWVTRRA